MFSCTSDPVAYPKTSNFPTVKIENKIQPLYRLATKTINDHQNISVLYGEAG